MTIQMRKEYCAAVGSPSVSSKNIRARRCPSDARMVVVTTIVRTLRSTAGRNTFKQVLAVTRESDACTAKFVDQPGSPITSRVNLTETRKISCRADHSENSHGRTYLNIVQRRVRRSWRAD